MSNYKKFFISFVDLFYPRHCLGCHQALSEKKFLCRDCENQIEPLSPPCCQICSYPLLSSDVKTCHNCAKRKLHFIAGIGAIRYRGLMRELLSRYKYGREQSLKPLLQHLILGALHEERLQEINFTAVVPVPLHALRQRERGFNQVLSLAQQVAKFKNLPLRLLLKRTSPTSFQAGSNRQRRLKNLEGAFSLRRPTSLRGNFLLVDDVLTTGATLNECAKVLLQAGANQVWAVTLAR